MCSAEYVAAVYSEIRADEVASEVPHSYTTARTLLSILRLSQALARLRFADHVDQVSLQCCIIESTCKCILYLQLMHCCCTQQCLCPAAQANVLSAPEVLQSVLVSGMFATSLIPCLDMLCGRQM